MWKNLVVFLGYEETRLFAFDFYWPLLVPLSYLIPNVKVGNNQKVNIFKQSNQITNSEVGILKSVELERIVKCSYSVPVSNTVARKKYPWSEKYTANF